MIANLMRLRCHQELDLMNTPITLAVHIAKPIAHVWKLWTDPAHIT